MRILIFLFYFLTPIICLAVLSEADKQAIPFQEMLRNPGFELSLTGNTSYSSVAPVRVVTAANVSRGNGSVSWDSTAANQTFDILGGTIPPGLYGRAGVGSCNIKGSGATHLLGTWDATTFSNSSTITSASTYKRTNIYFTYPTSGSLHLRLKSVAANEPLIYVDDCHLGPADAFSGGPVPIVNGGTGAATKAAGFDALQPMTTSGDVIYGGASGTGTRLPKGSDGQILKLASGLPTWANESAGGTKQLVFSSGSSGAFTTASGSAVSVTNMSVTVTNSGGMVFRISFVNDSSSNADRFGCIVTGASVVCGANAILKRNGTQISLSVVTTVPSRSYVPVSSLSFIDQTPDSGSNVYTLELYENDNGAGATAEFSYALMYVEEM